MTAHESQTQPSTGDGIFRSIAGFFTSVRTTIVLLFSLAAASVVGTVVPQEITAEELSRWSSPFWQRLVLILDLDDLFRSWWFILLLILLALNLAGCLIRRLPPLLREFQGRSERKSFSLDFDVPGSERDAHTVIVPALTSLMKTSPDEEPLPAGRRITWVKGRLYLLGFPLIHFAIILIMIGALIGLLRGYRGHVLIREGETVNRFVLKDSREVRQLPFHIAVDSFTLKRYPSGMPKEYRSDVRLLENGKEIIDTSIKVNHPLTHKGISLYQSDYRVVGVKSLRLNVVEPESASGEFVLPSDRPTTVPGTDYRIRALKLNPGMGMDGVELVLEIIHKSGKPHRLSTSMSDPEPASFNNLKLRFVSYDPLYATGLQVGYDPGTSVVWTGCIMLILGFLATLFLNPRRVTVHIEPFEQHAHVRITGQSRRMRKEFREEVTRTARQALVGEVHQETARTDEPETDQYMDREHND